MYQNMRHTADNIGLHTVTEALEHLAVTIQSMSASDLTGMLLLLLHLHVLSTYTALTNGPSNLQRMPQGAKGLLRRML